MPCHTAKPRLAPPSNSFKAQASFSSDTCKVSWIQISSRDYSFHSTSTTSIFSELKISMVFGNGQGYFKGFPRCCVDAKPLGQSRAQFPGSAARREKRGSVRFLLYTKTGSRLMCECSFTLYTLPALWTHLMHLRAAPWHCLHEEIRKLMDIPCHPAPKPRSLIVLLFHLVFNNPQ